MFKYGIEFEVLNLRSPLKEICHCDSKSACQQYSAEDTKNNVVHFIGMLGFIAVGR